MFDPAHPPARHRGAVVARRGEKSTWCGGALPPGVCLVLCCAVAIVASGPRPVTGRSPSSGVVFSDQGKCALQLRDSEGAPLLFPSGTTSSIGAIVDGQLITVAGKDGRHADRRVVDGGISCDREHAGVRVALIVRRERGAVVFRLRAHNAGDQARRVGFLVFLDTQLGRNDGSPLYIDQHRRLYRQEIEFVGTAPESWRSFDRYPNPQVESVAVYRDVPDRLAFLSWPKAKRDPLGYRPSDTRSFRQDSSTRARWDERPLAPGERREVVFSYGVLAAASPDWRVMLAAKVDRMYEARAALMRSEVQAAARALDTFMVHAVALSGTSLGEQSGDPAAKAVDATALALRGWQAGLPSALASAGPTLAFWAARHVGSSGREQTYAETLAELVDVALAARWQPSTPAAARLDALIQAIGVRAGMSASISSAQAAGAELITAIKGMGATRPARADAIAAVADRIADEWFAARHDELVAMVPGSGAIPSFLVLGEVGRIAAGLQAATSRAREASDALVHVDTASAVVGVIGLVKIIVGVKTLGVSVIVEGVVSAGALATGATGVVLQQEALRQDVVAAQLAVLAEATLHREIDDLDRAARDIATFVRQDLRSAQPPPSSPTVRVTASSQRALTAWDAARERRYTVTVEGVGGDRSAIRGAAVSYRSAADRDHRVGLLHLGHEDFAAVGDGARAIIRPPDHPSSASVGRDSLRLRVHVAWSPYHVARENALESSRDGALVRTELWAGTLEQGQRHAFELDVKPGGGAQWVHLFYQGSDIDLHLHAGGRHAGRNYATGRTDNDISGVTASGIDIDAHESVYIRPSSSRRSVRVTVVGVSLRHPERVRVVQERWPASAGPTTALIPRRTVVSGRPGDKPIAVRLFARELSCAVGQPPLTVTTDRADLASLMPSTVTLPPCGEQAVTVNVAPDARGAGGIDIRLQRPDGTVVATSTIEVREPARTLAAGSGVSWGAGSGSGRWWALGVMAVLLLTVLWLVMRSLGPVTAADSPDAGRVRSQSAAVKMPASDPRGAPIPATITLRARVSGAAPLVMRLQRGSTSLGRAPDNGVVIDVPQVSRHHAIVHVAADGVVFEHRAAADKTTVDGKPVPSGLRLPWNRGTAIRLAGDVWLDIDW